MSSLSLGSAVQRLTFAGRQISGTAFFRTIGCLLLLLPLFFCPVSSQDPAAELVEQSDTIFLGRVVGRQSYRSNDRGLVSTQYFFAVEESLNGEIGPLIVVQEWGGTVENVTLTLSHGVSYRPGGEYLVIARRNPQGILQTAQGSQGQLQVIRDAAGEGSIFLHSSHPLRGLVEFRSKRIASVGEVKSALLRELDRRGGSSAIR